MRLGLASDHRGFTLKEQIKETLKDEHEEIEIIDYGTDNDESTDYPDYAFKLGEAVANNKVDFGVAICGTGIGISIACNKVKGVRCAKVDSKEDALATRIDNDSNIIAFGEKTPIEKAMGMINIFINTPCSTADKHVRRRNKIKQYEENNYDR